MKMPNFLIIGAAKAGTTSLYHYIKQHPQIYMSPIKETNFFALVDEPLDFCGPGDHDYINRFSVRTIERYWEQFEGCTDELAVGEASPLYLYHAQAARRIWKQLPHVKLIVILRHPVDRAYSAFLHLIRDGREEHVDFGQALQNEDTRIRSRWEHIWHYKQMGYYYKQLKRYYDIFGHSQIRVYFYEDLKVNSLELIQDIFRFLGVDDTFVPDLSIRYNQARAVLAHTDIPPLRTEMRIEMIETYREDVLRLQDLVQVDLSNWLQAG